MLFIMLVDLSLMIEVRVDSGRVIYIQSLFCELFKFDKSDHALNKV